MFTHIENTLNSAATYIILNIPKRTKLHIFPQIFSAEKTTVATGCTCITYCISGKFSKKINKRKIYYMTIYTREKCTNIYYVRKTLLYNIYT